MAMNISRRTLIQTAAVAATAAVIGTGRAADDPAKIGVALVGGAHIHVPSFINTLKGRKDVSVLAVWDHDADRAQRRAKDLNAPVKGLDQIWNDKAIAAVVIGSETNRHRDLVLSAAQAAKHMFVEKPLGITAQESVAMAEAIEKAKVLFTTGYFMRGGPAVLFLKDQVQQGNFGQITRVRGSNCHSGSLGKWFDTEWRWMADPKIAGVGAFGDLGTHSLDLLMWLIGDIDSVAAEIKVVTGHYGDCDESGEALMRFSNGVTGTLAAGWVDVADPVTMLISGTQGHAAIINNQVHFRSEKVKGAEGGIWKDLPKALPHPLDRFLNAVGGQTGQALAAPREAAARVQVMEAMYKAAREKAWAKV